MQSETFRNSLTNAKRNDRKKELDRKAGTELQDANNEGLGCKLYSEMKRLVEDIEKW